MKELQTITPDNTTAIVKQVIKQKHTDTLVPYPGQKCWELNKITGELKEAEYETTYVKLGKELVTRKVIRKDYCDYVLAINKRNAEKKFFKNLRS